MQALAHGLQLLWTSQGLGLADWHDITGVLKASLSRILKAPMEQGFIWQRWLDDACVTSFSLAEAAGQLNRGHQVLAIALPVLEALTRQIERPSLLSVPRLSHLALTEHTTSRAVLAFCKGPAREAVLPTLRQSDRKGDRLARNADCVGSVLTETPAQRVWLARP